MKHNMPIFLICFIALIFMVGLIYLQISVWNECRIGHSFFYCLNLINHG